jgi:anti-anti-sigma factor
LENLTIKISARPIHRDVTLLSVNGFVYAGTISEFQKSVQQVLETQKQKIIFDLTETSYVSTAGWSVFLTALQQIRSQGGDILLARVKPEVVDIFEALDFQSHVQFYPNPGIAIQNGFGKRTTTALDLFPA